MSAGPRVRYCSAACRQRVYRERNGLYSWTAGEQRSTLCRQCTGRIEWVAAREGHWKEYCSAACKQRAYRERRREEAEQARRFHEEQRRRREHEEQARSRPGGGSGAGAPRSATSAEARAVVFTLAKLRDDGTTTLKKAYRAAAKKWHPDVNHSPGANETFKRLEEAAALLRNLGLLI
ncbi:DnaJ domain-containing protein [Streptomyces sp. NPDC059193]|uniref:DnaJ domain-containing protein n=1 Tax=Streptomyces sp. NPDC059193 TaxID=3346763 RepID=UPI00369CB40D